jgi:hypothetical protein
MTTRCCLPTARAIFLLAALLFLTLGSSLARSETRVDGTTGSPLGGFGAGAVKFNAHQGTFSAMLRPPADAYDFERLHGAKFLFFAKRDGTLEKVDPLKAPIENGRAKDDAIWPLHYVDFGTVHGVRIHMTGFSPFDRQDASAMSLPYAFYEFSLTNEGSSPASAACALQVEGEKGSFRLAPKKGFSSPKWAALVASSDPSAAVSAGSPGSFFDNGELSGTFDDLAAAAAARVELKPGETKAVKFVLAWYDDTDPERSYCFGIHKEPGAIAAVGLEKFDALKANAESLVTRMRGSNLPDWLANQSLSALAIYATNSMYKKDGRVAWAEGQWTCFGTMDQMWHARQIVAQLTPFFAWQELEYWARTQRKDGQIHHDFNYFDGGSEKATRSVLVPWDDTEHKDYRKIDKWVDLNCGYIISVFETRRITGDDRKFEFHWPHMKRAIQRVFDQVEKYGSEEYPFTFDDSENSYDAGGDPNPFNASISAVAYKLMAQLARQQGDGALATQCEQAFRTVVESYRKRYIQGKFPKGKHSEGYFAGQWLALHLKLGEIWTAEETDAVLKKLDERCHPLYWGLGHPKGTYDEWTPYILTHYAGLLLNTRRVDQWEAMQKDSWFRQYEDRNKVFNHPLDILPKVKEPKLLAEQFHSGKEYMSLPGIWRNYFDIAGFHRDAGTGTLWLNPKIPDGLNHQLSNVAYFSPEGDGVISCLESGSAFQNREITFKPDKPILVKTLRLDDPFGEKVAVTVDGETVPARREGSGYAKELAVDLNRTIGPEGMRVVASGDPGKPAPPAPERPQAELARSDDEGRGFDAFAEIQAEDSTQAAGVVLQEKQVGSCNNFDYLRFDKVDFGKEGATGFTASVTSLATGASIDIVLDSVSGDSIGLCKLPDPKADGKSASVSCEIRKTTGVHDVVFRFFGPTSDDLMLIDSFRFIK